MSPEIKRLADRYKLPEDFVERYVADTRPNGFTSRTILKELGALVPSPLIAARFMEEADNV